MVLKLPIDKIKTLCNNHNVNTLILLNPSGIKVHFLILMYEKEFSKHINNDVSTINLLDMYQIKVIADYVFPYELISLGTQNGISFDYWDYSNNIKSKHIELFEFNVYESNNDIKNILTGLSIVSKLRCFSKNRKQPDIIENSIKDVITSSINKLNKLINNYSTKQTKEKL